MNETMLTKLNKPLIGVLLGAVLGLIDGSTAWFTPEARSQMQEILIGSTVKGMMTGIAAGFFARRFRSLALGIGFGLIIGLLLSYGVAAMGGKYYLEIMLPGSILGALVGFATQRYGKEPRLAGN
jgi:hypothetical protein